MSSLKEMRGQGTILGLDSVDAAVERHDMAFVTTVGESVSGSFLLTRASGGSKNITLSQLSRPIVISIRSEATVVVKCRQTPGSTTTNDHLIRVDGFMVVQIPQSPPIVELNLSHVGATTAKNVHYLVASPEAT